MTNDSGDPGRDWFAWHRAYDDPDSDLRRRIGAVQGFTADALARQPPGRIRRPTIRHWFRDRGFEETGFASAEGTGWGVGANRMVVDPEPYQRDVRLFIFRTTLDGAMSSAGQWDRLNTR